MNTFESRIKTAIALLRSKPIYITDFWMYFINWLESVPNSQNDRASIENMRISRVFKSDLLLAYHLLGDTLLKRVLAERIKHCQVTQQEFEDASYAALTIGYIKRKR